MNDEKTCNVTLKVAGIGQPAAGAQLMIYLHMEHGIDKSRLRDRETGLAPRSIDRTVTTDSSGRAVVDLWPNTLANHECTYMAWVWHSGRGCQQRLGEVPDLKECSITLHV